jgi:hypothetical protein
VRKAIRRRARSEAIDNGSFVPSSHLHVLVLRRALVPGVHRRVLRVLHGNDGDTDKGW